jgi:GT2 family glycosyltransferase
VPDIDVSIVIVSYNTRNVLRDCCSSIRDGVIGLKVDVCVVDNASTDGSPEMVASEFPEIRLVRNRDNSGFAAANNVALQDMSGRYALLLNPDTILRQESITNMVAFMEVTPRAGFCGPRLLNSDGTHQPSAYRFPTTLTHALPVLGLNKRFSHSRHVTNLHSPLNDKMPFLCDRLCGACILARCEAIQEVGLLDPAFFLYFEETDWCKRMVKAEWEGWYIPSSEVVHLGGQSVAIEKPDQPFFGKSPVYWIKSMRCYMRKHHGLFGLIVSQGALLMAYTMVLVRNSWPFRQRHTSKRKMAMSAIRVLLLLR